MPKGEEERRKSESKSSGSSEVQSSKSERRTSVESSAASALDDRKESISSAQLTGSSFSIESIVIEETEPLSDVEPAKPIQKSETEESQLLGSGLLQPPAPENTKVSPRVSPLKEFFSNLAQKLHLSGPPRKSPPNPSPEIEEHVSGQELMEECIVKLPPKDKKTQTETRNITSQKRDASFLSPETYDGNESSTSQSTTADERDLITPSPTPRLDASKMTLAITGFEPAKPEPGPFQKLRKLMGLEKEEKPLISDQTGTKCERDTEAKSTQTINFPPMSAIITEGLSVLKDQNRVWVSSSSTSESADYTEWSQGTSEHSMDCISSMNADTSGSSPQKSPVEVCADASLTGSEESLQVKFERANIGEKPVVKKMPNPVIEMLKHEKSDDVDDKATSTSPRKNESVDSLSKSPTSIQKQTVPKTCPTETSQEEEMNVEETTEASGSIAESSSKDISLPISENSKEGNSVGETVEDNESVAEPNVRDILIAISKSSVEGMIVEEISNQGTDSCGSVSEADVKDLSIAENNCKKVNVEEPFEEAKCLVAQTDEKEFSISKTQCEEMNVKEACKEAKSESFQSDKSPSFSKTQDEDTNVEAIFEETGATVSVSERKDSPISTSRSEEMNVEENSKESTDSFAKVPKPDISFPISKGLGEEENIEKPSKEACGDISQPDEKHNSISTSRYEEMNVARTSEKAEIGVTEPDKNNLSSIIPSTSSCKEMNVEEISKEVESTVGESDKDTSISKRSEGMIEDSKESSDTASRAAQPDSSFSISKDFGKEINIEKTSHETDEARGSASQPDENDRSVSTSHSNEMNVDILSKEAGSMVCKADEKDLSIPKTQSEEMIVEKIAKEAVEAVSSTSQVDIPISAAKCVEEEIKVKEILKEASEAAAKPDISSSVSISQDEEMDVEGIVEAHSEVTGKVPQSDTSCSISTTQDKGMNVEDVSKEASESTGRVTELITLFSSSTSPGEETKAVEASKKTSEVVGRDNPSDISISTNQAEEMNVEDAMQESSAAGTEIAESDIKDTSSASTTLDEEQMDTS